jgi:hypothetical protein
LNCAIDFCNITGNPVFGNPRYSDSKSKMLVLAKTVRFQKEVFGWRYHPTYLFIGDIADSLDLLQAEITLR